MDRITVMLKVINVYFVKNNKGVTTWVYDKKNNYFLSLIDFEMAKDHNYGSGELLEINGQTAYSFTEFVSLGLGNEEVAKVCKELRDEISFSDLEISSLRLEKFEKDINKALKNKKVIKGR